MTGRLTTFDQAHRVGAYDLARRWLERHPSKDVVDELDELAVMAALRAWLEGWTPIHIHRSLLAGATVEQVAAAAGLEPFDVSVRWREWSDGQRHLWESYPDMDRTAEHDRVAEILAQQEVAQRQVITDGADEIERAAAWSAQLAARVAAVEAERPAQAVESARTGARWTS